VYGKVEVKQVAIEAHISESATDNAKIRRLAGWKRMVESCASHNILLPAILNHYVVPDAG
jgi:hypothetical protein